MAGTNPRTMIGSIPPGLAVNSAPIWRSGSITRPIGRLDRLASPMKVAVSRWLATSPINNRVEVPLLPMSSAPDGCIRPPTPTPLTVQLPSQVRSICAPMARIAAAVASTSSPSSKPEILLSPTASALNISARCEMDLSPGTLSVPNNAPLGWKLPGLGTALCMMFCALRMMRVQVNDHSNF